MRANNLNSVWTAVARHRLQTVVLLTFLFVAVKAFAQEVLMREVVSRELSYQVEPGVSSPVAEAFSREVSYFVEPADPDLSHEVVSREVSFVMASTNPPPKIEELVITASPTGERVTLDWVGYDQWAVGDIDHFEIYYTASGAFSDISGAGLSMVAVPGGTTSFLLDGLPAFTDHYFAVVAVDALGNYIPAVDYAASYVLSPETVSRAVSWFVEPAHPDPGSEIISREVSYVVASTNPPPAMASFDVVLSPGGETATLSWPDYDQYEVGDLARFDIYYTDNGAFSNIQEPGLQRISVPAGSISVVLDGLATFTDHYFAVVPVDALGNHLAEVIYGAGYVISPEVMSRELSCFVESTPRDIADAVSREVSYLVPDAAVPPPVTGLDSGFEVTGSKSEFSAVLLDFTAYDEQAAMDVTGYDVYVGISYFEDVSGLIPFARLPNGNQRVELTGLPANTILYFAVVAVDALGNFDPSVRALSALTSIAGVGEAVDFTVTGGSDTLSYTWGHPPDSEDFRTGYSIYFDGTNVPLNLPANTTTWQATGLERGRGYFCRICSIDGFGSESDGVSILGATWLPNPINLSLSESSGDVVLEWDASEPSQLVKQYEIYRSASPISDIGGMVPVKASTGLRATLGSLTDVENEWFAVAAVNILGDTDPSVESIQVFKLGQTITFPPIVPGPLQIPLVASASSGLPVRYTVSPSRIASIAGSNTLAVVQGGTVRVAALQDGNAGYWPAEASQTLRLPPVIQSFTADGNEVSDGTVFGRDVLLQVDARDADGIDAAHYRIRAVGAVSWTALGSGASVNLPVSTLEPGNYELQVEVIAGGTNSTSRTQAVLLDLEPVLSIALGEDIFEGMQLNGTVSVHRVLSSDLPVTIASSIPSQLDSGPVVTIPAGQSNAVFTIIGRQDSEIEDDVDVRVTASAPGAIGAGRTVTLYDDDWPSIELTLNRTIIPESAGPNAAIASLVRSPVTDEPLTVWLVNSDPTAANVPLLVTIPAGEAYAGFYIGAIDDDVEDGPQTVEIQAEVRLQKAGVIAQSTTRTLTVGDDEGPVLELLAGTEWIFEGETNSLTVLRHGGDTNGPVEIHFEVDVPADLQIPASVSLASNTVETVAEIVGLDGTNGSRVVIVTASATNYGPAQLTLVVTDELMPDFVVSQLDVPVQLEAEATFDVSYVLENRGSGASSQAFSQRIFFSEDAVPGGDLLLAQETVAGAMAVGETNAIVTNVRAPQTPGLYWLFVIADAGLEVDELIEWNNAMTFPQPISVGVPWSVVVQTDADLVSADTPLLLYGSAVKAGAEKVPNVTVNIHIRHAGTERVVSAITDSNGDFELSWQPLPGEGGDYEIGACHPGTADAPTQDAFAILTATPVFPAGIQFTQGGGTTFTGTVHNPTAYDLTGLELEIVDAPDGLDIETGLSGTELAGGATLDLSVSVVSTNGLSGDLEFIIRLTNDQGVVVDIPIGIKIIPLRPELVISPQPLKASVLRGSSRIVDLTIENTGGMETGPIHVLLPDAVWINLASPGSIPSIPPGGSGAVSLRLSPGTAQPLTLYEGYLVMAPQNGDAVNLPFAFRVVSDATGDLQVEVKDEFTYFAEGNPPVEGAGVILRDAVTAEELMRGATGTNGLVRFDGIPEGWYSVEVDSTNHIRTVQTFQLQAGELNELSLFASRELVKYRWSVEEVDLNDRYRISIESTYEVNVPAPVVTVTPNVLDVSDLDELGETKVVNLVVENHGWINAEHGAFNFGSHPYYSIEPLIENVGTIAAKSAIVVPVVMRRTGGVQTVAAKSMQAENEVTAESAPCSIAAQFLCSYFCGAPVGKIVPIAISGVEGNCGGDGSITIVGAEGGGGSITLVPKEFETDKGCCPGGDFQECQKGKITIDAEALAYVLKEGVGRILSYSPYPIAIYKTDVKSEVTGEICLCCREGVYDYALKGSAKVEVEVEIGIGKGVSIPKMDFDTTDWSTLSVQANLLAGARCNLKGSVTVDGGKECFKDAKEMCAKGELKGEVNLGGSVRGSATGTAGSISYSGEIKGNLGISGQISIEAEMCGDDPMAVTACGEISADAFLTGTLKPNTGFGDDKSLSVGSRMILVSFCAGDTASSEPLVEGEVPKEATASSPLTYTVPQDELWLSDEEIRAQINMPPGGGVCAQVRIRVDQEAVMTRSAFRATLELENTQDTAALTDVYFDLDVRDALLQPAGDRFNVQVTDLTGLDAIDGTGTIGSNSIGRVQWTLIPRDSAAPVGDTAYTVGGTISYAQGGQRLSIPVQPISITVKPDAALFLKYFHQRDVVSDDPHTDPIEAREPFALAVVVENRGAGMARNLSIASAQPEIVDNEKGLLIDFEIVGSELAGEMRSASLMADFGDIAPGGQKTATWWMTASLHGFFQDYEATFEHLDGFGDPRISLIKDVQIFEMIRAASALGALDDGQPDFFTNEEIDPDFYPVGDTLHLSDGTIAAVGFLGAGAACPVVTPEHPTVELTLTNGARTGWTYLRFPDPADGAFRLVQVVRSDGLVIPVGTNVWTTDRTFVGMGLKPVYENYLHLLDHDSTGEYTLYYDAIPDDAVAPQSAVAALPASSGIYVPVSWSGSDDVAVASFDIMVSTNGGPWGVWLENTTRISSLFLGEAGQHYAFYSIATDTSGNAESKPAVQEAATTVSAVNLPPVMQLIAATNIAEGATLEYQVRASDPDGSTRTLRYTVVSSRTGATIDYQGLLRWPTSELDGGSSNRIQVSVMDAGLPLGLTSAWFTVTVDEWNQPPVFDPKGPQVIEGGKTLVTRVQATDYDFPEQAVSYGLGAGSPAGMTIDPLYGLIDWAAPTGMIGQGVVVEVVASDTGYPVAFATNTFTVSVVEKIIDTTRPLPIPDLAVSPDTGISDSDGIIAVTNFTLSGTLPESGLDVEVYLESTNGILEQLSSDTPYGTDLLMPLSVDRVGNVNLVVRTIDESGNSTDTSLKLYIDLEAPVVDLHLDGAMRDATNYLELTSARMTFSEPVNVAGLVANGLMDQAVRLSSTNVWVAPLMDELTWHSISNTLVWNIPTNAVVPGEWMLHVDGAFVTDLAGNRLAVPDLYTEQGMPVYGGSSEWIATLGCSVPAWHDFDGDGLGDLLVGEMNTNSQGRVRIYLNEGTATNPLFSAFTLLDVDGGAFAVPGSGCLGVSLRMADMTDDGLADLVVGWSDGSVWLHPAVSIGNIGSGTQIWSGASRAVVDVFDLDADGTHEIVVGGLDGLFHILDEGNSSTLGDPVMVAAGRSAPSLFDLNGDGLPELVSGDSNGRLWSFFGDALLNDWNGTAWPLAETQEHWSRSRPCVADVNGDGLADILLGTYDGRVRVFLADAPRNPAVTATLADPGERYIITAGSGEGGHIEPEGEIAVFEGEDRAFDIVPDPYWHVVEVFANGISLGPVSSYTFINVGEDGVIHAGFAQNMVTNAPVPVPESWLAEYGWTNDFESVVTNDFDGDGFAAWEEYVAGTSPIDSASVFRITQIQAVEGELLIVWSPSLSGRRYHLMHADSPGEAFEEIDSTDGPADTLTAAATGDAGIFRMEVELTGAPPQWTVLSFAGANGTITPSGLQYATPGSNTFHFAITPDEWYHIADVKTNGVSLGAVETLTLSNVTANVGVQVEFEQNVVLGAPVAVSERYLAGFGWTNNLESVVTNDFDGDGFAVWQEYVAGSLPKNAESYFRITQIRTQDGGLLITWSPSVEDRRYRVMRAAALGDPFSEELGRVVGPANSMVVPASQSSGMLRIEVELADAGPQWQVVATAGSNGTITPSGLFYAIYGSNTFQFTVSPDPWYHIVDVTVNGVSTGAVESLLLENIDRNMEVHASFAENLLTNAPVAIPEYWLAGYGWTTGFSSILTNDADLDGFATWQEYVAGSDPTNNASCFRITNSVVKDGRWIIEWEPSSFRRIYTPVLLGLSGNTPLASIEGGAVNAFTNEVLETSGMLRVDVEMKE